jgi:hypothetical protein
MSLNFSAGGRSRLVRSLKLRARVPFSAPSLASTGIVSAFGAVADKITPIKGGWLHLRHCRLLQGGCFFFNVVQAGQSREQ